MYLSMYVALINEALKFRHELSQLATRTVGEDDCSFAFLVKIGQRSPPV
jgi:hypothetical protein